MAPRLELHNLLVGVLGKPNQVYFQPPPNIHMQYPAIVYSLDRIETQYGSNAPYLHDKRYSVTYIDRDPDSDVPMKLAKLPKCSHTQSFTTDGLNHNVFTIYY